MLEGRGYMPTGPHPLCEAYDEGVNHSCGEYSHLAYFQLEELLYQPARAQQPEIEIQVGSRDDLFNLAEEPFRYSTNEMIRLLLCSIGTGKSLS